MASREQKVLDSAAYGEIISADAFGPKTQAMFDHLSRRCVGQERAHRRVARGFAMHNADLREDDEPIGVFLFSGPTGWGKTHEAKEIARFLIADRRRAPLTLIQCGKYSEPHRISEIIGAPPGYVNSEDSPKLAQYRIDKPDFYNKMADDIDRLYSMPEYDPHAMHELYNRNGPYTSVICFDEVEKAHNDLHSALLHVVDDGMLEFAQERTSFKHSVIILTCNVGGREQQDLISGRSGTLGFGNAGRDIEQMSDDELEALDKKIYQQTVDLIERLFAPELVGRLRDEIVVFRTLSRVQQGQILELFLGSVQKRMAGKDPISLPITVDFAQPFKEFLLDKGINRLYGMRPLKRTVDKYVRLPLANAIESKQLRPGDELLFTSEHGKPVLRRRGLSKSRPVPTVTLK